MKFRNSTCRDLENKPCLMPSATTLAMLCAFKAVTLGITLASITRHSFVHWLVSHKVAAQLVSCHALRLALQRIPMTCLKMAIP
ncbi:hypothetical protein HAX54_033480, partial [Datura stramonium]|nr:hypothetical protein [Datura stramonium]